MHVSWELRAANDFLKFTQLINPYIFRVRVPPTISHSFSLQQIIIKEFVFLIRVFPSSVLSVAFGEVHWLLNQVSLQTVTHGL